MDPELQEIAVPVEPAHCWFVARRRIDFGWGRGYMLAGFPASWRRLGVDPSPRAVVERMALGGGVTDGLDT